MLTALAHTSASVVPTVRPALFVHPAAESVAFGSSFIDLRTRGPLRRILLALVAQHSAAPGTALSADVVFDAGWPAERASAKAAAARVYTAVYTLRRMGLRGVLVRRDDGYLLVSDITVETLERFEAGEAVAS